MVGGSSETVGGTLVGKGRKHVRSGRVAGDTTEDDTSEKGRSTKTVGSVDTTGQLSTGKDTWDRLVLFIVNGGIGTDLETTHGVMQDWRHEGDVVVVVHFEITAREELSSVRSYHVREQKELTFLPNGSDPGFLA